MFGIIHMRVHEFQYRACLSDKPRGTQLMHTN